MQKRLSLVIVAILATTSVQAYIDPGTGGYLLASLWGWLVAMLSFAIASVGYFFRHTLVIWSRMAWKKHRTICVAVIGIILITLTLLIVVLIPKADSADDLPDATQFTNESYSELEGVTIYKPDETWDGYNYANGTLFDMEGTIVHRWDTGYIGAIDTTGDLYAQGCYECATWGRYTWDGDVIWEMELPIHHEILLTPDDTVIVFTKEVHDYRGRNVEFDVIAEFDKNGTLIDSWSTWEKLEYLQSFHAALQLDLPKVSPLPENHYKNTSIWGGNYDYYHLNSLALVPENQKEGTHPAFNPGNWIISFRHGSMVFILDKDTKEVLWRAIDDQVHPGRLEGPHSPHMLEDGTIILMDNGRYREWGRVIIIDPVTLATTWEYRAADFFTLSQGYVQPLSNGNYLVTESEDGRAFELTPNKEIVWEWFTSDRWGYGEEVKPEYMGKRRDVYRVMRYPSEMIEPLLG